MKSSRLIKISILTSLATLTCANVHADELDLKISNDWANINYISSQPEGKTAVGFGYLYKEDKDDDDSDVNVANLDLHAIGQTAIGNLPTTVGIGFQATYFKDNQVEGSAIGIGGSVRSNLPAVPGLSIETSVHYAPDVLAFSGSNEFRRASLQANYRVIENADISLGYKYIVAGIEETDGKHTLEKGLYLGFSLKL